VAANRGYLLKGGAGHLHETMLLKKKEAHKLAKLMTVSIFDYFGRVAIIHLPERVDRFRLLKAELASVGLDIHSSKVEIPTAPRPSDPNGFPSCGVYGNFLSHLTIIEKAHSDGLESVLVLEDDAIFSKTFNREQAMIARCLSENAWDQVFLGHSIADKLPYARSGLVRFTGDFFWAHCYAVHRRIMPRLISYMRQTIEREAGSPLGGKMYIDGAFTLFKRTHPDVICLVSSPRLSIQRGSSSSLNNPAWYARSRIVNSAVGMARYMRDEAWRRGLIEVAPKATSEMNFTGSVVPWPER
jgi:glycosyl transferase family 25